jgi:cyclase
VIPALLIQGRDLVKTTGFDDPTYLGDPINTVRLFSEKGADELAVLAIDQDGPIPDLDFLAELASECFMPVSYGGGLRTVDQCAAIFELGMEKVVLRQALFDDPTLISAVAGRFGSQAVCVCIDYRGGGADAKLWRPVGVPELSLQAAVERAVSAGAGEIMLQSIDRDGTMAGYDLASIELVSGISPVPVVPLGGAGALADMVAAEAAGATAVAAGSFFVFHGRRRAVLVSYPTDDELEDCLR